MTRIRLHPYRLPLIRPWVAASATLAERRGWLVEIGEGGIAGLGDCAPLPSAGSEDRCLAALEALAATGRLPDDAPPEARWAFETATLDLEAQRRGIPLAKLLGAQTLSVPVNAALGPLDDGCAQRAEDAAARGFAVSKVKVGLAPVDEELARLCEVAQASGMRLRLDANRAWSEADALHFLSAAAALPVEAVEEPLAAPSLDALSRLQAALPFDIAVDESLAQLGADALFASRAVRRVVLKPARVGGLRETLALAERAKQAGMAVVITSVVDSAIGVAAAAHLAAAVDPAMAHGLATGKWLASDVAKPLPVRDGRLWLRDEPGLGLIRLMP